MHSRFAVFERNVSGRIRKFKRLFKRNGRITSRSRMQSRVRAFSLL